MSDTDFALRLFDDERFARFEPIQWWDQSLLARARVLVVGAGALGNEVIKNLCLLGAGNLVIADRDHVERTNLSRSVLFRESDEGQPKAECAARAASGLYPGVRAVPLCGNILADVGLGYFHWADVVVGALDNREARVFVNQICARLGKLWIDGGIDVFQGVVRGFQPPRTSCYECTMSQVDWDMLNRRRSCSLVARRAATQGGTPTTPITASVIGALQAQEVVKCLHGREPLAGRGYLFDGATFDSYPVSYPINPDCPWHEDEPTQVLAATSLTSDASLSAIWDLAQRELGGLDAIEFAREIVDTLRCPSCDCEARILKPAENVTEAQLRCPQCGAESVPSFVHSVSGDSDLLSRRLRDVGIPKWDIIWARRGEQYIGVEIAGDLPAWFQPRPSQRLEAMTSMSRRKRSRRGQEETNGPAESGSAFSESSEAERQSAEGWKDRKKPTRRPFPGPRGMDEPLRVAMERVAYAEVVAHAKESLDAEICGVLVGTECVDDDGLFVHAQAAVRGAKAHEGSTHVTFTQETWNTIHETIESDHPKLQIVGWYHSHPGFGVEFSDMDIFIQNNFFPGEMQIALVTDPLGGDMAICVNDGDGVRYLPRFWVDAREQRCFAPAGADGGSARTTNDAADETIASLEMRVSQLIHTVDDLRRTFYRWVTTLGMLLGLAIMFFIASQVSYIVFGRRPELPRKYSFAPVPVEIDGKPCLLGVNIVSWKIPEELIPTVQPKRADDESGSDGDEPSSDRSTDKSPTGAPSAPKE